MRIGIVTHNFPRIHGKGSEAAGNFVVSLCEALIEAGHTVWILTPDVNGEKQKFPFHVEWFCWSGGDRLIGHYKPWNPLHLAKIIDLIRSSSSALNTILQKKPVDMLLALWAFPSGLICTRRVNRVPLAIWCLGSDIWTFGNYPIGKQIVRSVLRQATWLYADGMQLAEDVRILSRKACQFLPTSRKKRTQITHHKTKIDSHFTLLYVGRWEKAKGIDILLKALPVLFAQYPDIRAEIFGGGSLESTVTSLVQNLQNDYSGRIVIGGYLSEQEFCDRLDSCDIYVIPSRKESIPIALTDAICRCVPVVTSTAGDMAKLVQQYDLGFTFTKCNVTGLIEAICKAYKQRLSIEPQKALSFMEKFALESVVKELERAGAENPESHHLFNETERYIIR
ncbi:MAG TPA: glycosyltransferase family 4 protein [Chitinispirillaceae bacterium]|nr:glycosyltransferase family 4 protein [Chitinispirillaceae bacterium]